MLVWLLINNVISKIQKKIILNISININKTVLKNKLVILE